MHCSDRDSDNISASVHPQNCTQPQWFNPLAQKTGKDPLDTQKVPLRSNQQSTEGTRGNRDSHCGRNKLLSPLAVDTQKLSEKESGRNVTRVYEVWSGYFQHVHDELCTTSSDRQSHIESTVTKKQRQGNNNALIVVCGARWGGKERRERGEKDEGQ